MLSCSPWSASFAVLVFTLAVASPSLAQKVETEEIKFDTADGVKLQGTLYKAILDEKAKIVAAKDISDCPCVMILHSPGTEPNTGDWGGLAESLAAKGFHVFRFDFRGHGRSKEVNKEFWELPINVAAFPTLAKKKPLPPKIEWNDIKAKPAYFPYLVNDILAARVMLDRRNDEGKLNTSSVYLIGATEAAPLGMLYIATEWTRPQKLLEVQAKLLKTLPAPYQTFLYEAKESAGRDIAGAFWLSPRKHSAIDTEVMKRWVKDWPDMREKTPVICFTGEKDMVGTTMSKLIVEEILVAKPKSNTALNSLKYTNVKTAVGSKNIGVDLLGKQLKTEEAIFKQLEDLEKERTSVTKVGSRNYTTPPMVNLSSYGIR
jgi:hypothetical protein